VWWSRELTVEAASADDAHRPLEKVPDLAASLSHVEKRQVRPDYTLRWDGKVYQIERSAVTAGLRGADARMERRLDGSLAVRHGSRLLSARWCFTTVRILASLCISPNETSATSPGCRARQ
jgi:hypothetical protein